MIADKAAGEKVHGSASLVHDINGLVRKKPVAHMACRELHHGLQDFLGIADLVVVRVAALQAEQYLEALVAAGLADVDALKAPGKGAVLFEVVSEFLVGGGAHAAQISAGKQGLQEVRGVHGAARRGAGAHDGVDLVYEEDGPLMLPKLLHDGLEPGLEVAAVAAARKDKAKVQGKDLRVGEHVRHLSACYAQGKALCHGSLANARIAHEEGIVLAPAAKDLDGTIELCRAPDQGIELAFPCLGCEVRGVLFKRTRFRIVLVGSLASLACFLACGAAFRILVVGVGDKAFHLKEGDTLAVQVVDSVVVLVLHHGNQEGAQVHCVAAGVLHADGCPLEKARQGDCLHDFVRHSFGNGFDVGAEKAVQLLAQHGNGHAAPLEQHAAAHDLCIAVEQMLYCQYPVPAFLGLEHGLANHHTGHLAEIHSSLRHPSGRRLRDLGLFLAHGAQQGKARLFCHGVDHPGLGGRDLLDVGAALGNTLVVNLFHESYGLALCLVEDFLKDKDHKFLGRVVVVVQIDGEAGRFLETGFRENARLAVWIGGVVGHDIP